MDSEVLASNGQWNGQSFIFSVAELQPGNHVLELYGGDRSCTQGSSTFEFKIREMQWEQMTTHNLNSLNFLEEVNSYEYIACFRDDGDRDFDFGPQAYGYNQETCRDACAEYKYFALQNNGWCSCDNNYGMPEETYPQIDDSECNVSGEGMGGGWANAVY
jgi:hypothetical protein